MKILGLRCAAGLPIMEILCTNYDNYRGENYLEIAQRYYEVEPGRYTAIILIESENNWMDVYNRKDFTR